MNGYANASNIVLTMQVRLKFFTMQHLLILSNVSASDRQTHKCSIRLLLLLLSRCKHYLRLHLSNGSMQHANLLSGKHFSE